jgi:hypothetical protein
MQWSAGFAHRFRGARVLAAAALVLVVAGCVMSQVRKDEADAKARTAYAQCDDERRAGKLTTHLAAVNCAVPTVVRAYQESAYPFTDLIYVSVQARRIGARRVDSGDVTEAQYQQDLATLQTRIAAEDDRRRGIMKYGGDPQPAPAGALVEGLSAFAPAPVRAALPPPGANPNCVPLGQIRSCK